MDSQETKKKTSKKANPSLKGLLNKVEHFKKKSSELSKKLALLKLDHNRLVERSAGYRKLARLKKFAPVNATHDSRMISRYMLFSRRLEKATKVSLHNMGILIWASCYERFCYSDYIKDDIANSNCYFIFIRFALKNNYIGKHKNIDHASSYFITPLGAKAAQSFIKYMKKNV
jgi:hypothetical protein